jgi:hypothetical protein
MLSFCTTAQQDRQADLLRHCNEQGLARVQATAAIFVPGLSCMQQSEITEKLAF